MLLAASTVIVLILIAGFFPRHRRPIHIRLMIAAFSLDLALVLVIELTRGAIHKTVSSPPPLLLFHVTMSVFSLLFYVAMAVLGNGVRKGRNDGGRCIANSVGCSECAGQQITSPSG